MQFTFSWLKNYLDTSASTEEVSYALNSIGLEVENITDKGKIYSSFIIAEIVEANPHPNADKLRVCKVNNGETQLQIVCGAANARAGIKVVLAPVGTIIPANNMEIKASKIRDVESNGMLCSTDELLIEGDSEGIIELPADAKIGAKFADYAGLNEVIFDIAITPNRGDMASIYGIARDLAAKGIGTLLPYPEVNINSLKDVGNSPIFVTIDDKANCHKFVVTYISRVNNLQSAPKISNTLKGAGYSLNSALVDISNYTMFSFGRPNHIYDADKIKGNITVRKSKAGEGFIAIGGTEYTLEEGITVIADEEKILCVAGVIGGELSKVTEDTKNILVEVAEFDPIAVSLAGRKLNINTDSRFRFERGIDFGITDYIVNYLNAKIIEICGGEAHQSVFAIGSNRNCVTDIKFDFKYIEVLGGVTIPEGTAREILNRLGFTIQDNTISQIKEYKERGAMPIEIGERRVDDAIFKNGNWYNTISIPAWRQGSMEGKHDLVEEILRIYGYEFVPSNSLPKAPCEIFSAEPDIASHLEKNIRHSMISRELYELVTLAFVDNKVGEEFGFSDHIKLVNPISSELNSMRKTMAINLLDVVRKNQARGYLNLGFFEMGSIYNNEQQKCISGIRVGKINPASVHKNERTIDFYDSKADLFAAVQAYGFDPEKLLIKDNTNSTLPSYYHPNRAAAFFLGKTVIGFCGEIHPSICKKYDINGSAVFFELFYENLPKPKASTKRAKFEVYDYQSVERDFAFIVSDSTAAIDMIKEIQKADNIIEAVNVFDVYQNVESGKKSIAISVRIQPISGTLSEIEINKISDKIINIAQTKFNAKLRCV